MLLDQVLLFTTVLDSFIFLNLEDFDPDEPLEVPGSDEGTPADFGGSTADLEGAEDLAGLGIFSKNE